MIKQPNTSTSSSFDVVTHSSYFLNLKPSDYHFFNKSKKLLDVQWFLNDKEVQKEVKKWLRVVEWKVYKSWSPSLKNVWISWLCRKWTRVLYISYVFFYFNTCCVTLLSGVPHITTLLNLIKPNWITRKIL